MSDATQRLVFITSCTTGDDGAITAFTWIPPPGPWSYCSATPMSRTHSSPPCRPTGNSFFGPHTGSLDREPGSIAAFEIVGDSGALRKINQQPARGVTTCYVDVDPTGKAVVCANYTSGSVGAYPVQTDGSLGEMTSFIEHQGARPGQPGPAGSRARALRRSQSQRPARVRRRSGHRSDPRLRLDAASATLTPLDQSYVRTIGGGGPATLPTIPRGGSVRKQRTGQLGKCVQLRRRCGLLIERQVISTLPDGFEGESYTADIKITPDGNHLYCSNRMHDSIAIYRIGEDGCLTLVDIPSSLGNFAQTLAITPDGSMLLCANMQGDDANVAVFRIDAASGKLSAVWRAVGLSSRLVS